MWLFVSKRLNLSYFAIDYWFKIFSLTAPDFLRKVAALLKRRKCKWGRN